MIGLKMKDRCPECGEPYDEPQPDDYICGDCSFKKCLSSLLKDKDIRKKVILLKI